MMKTLTILLFCFGFMLWAGSGLAATPLNGEYTISEVQTNLGGGSYKFDYSVTNNNQGGWPWGLDGFFVQVPVGTQLTSITIPPPYKSSLFDHWVGVLDVDSNGHPLNGGGTGVGPQPGYEFVEWWGEGWKSVYPEGNTVDFSFTATIASLGANTGNTGVVTTFLGYQTFQDLNLYADYTFGPATAVPLPGALFLFGPGLAGLAVFRRKFKK
jgi:hypothetical protein